MDVSRSVEVYNAVISYYHQPLQKPWWDVGNLIPNPILAAKGRMGMDEPRTLDVGCDSLRRG